MYFNAFFNQYIFIKVSSHLDLPAIPSESTAFLSLLRQETYLNNNKVKQA